MRARVVALKAKLEQGLAALGGVVAGNTRFAATKLEELADLAVPLLASHLVGEWQTNKCHHHGVVTYACKAALHCAALRCTALSAHS